MAALIKTPVSNIPNTLYNVKFPTITFPATAKEQLFSKTLINCTSIIIPSYQRKFTWGEENWKRLWNSITRLYDKKENYLYLGNICIKAQSVLTNSPKEAVDGQQRIICFQIITLCLYNRWKSQKHTQMNISALDYQNVRDELSTILSTHTIANNPSQPPKQLRKLFLKEESEPIYEKLYEKYFENHSLKTIKKINFRKTEKQKKIYGCFEYFNKQINDIDPQELPKYWEAIMRKTFVSTIAIDWQEDNLAAQVFISLNDANVPLTPIDLFHSWLLFQFDANEDGKTDPKKGIYSRAEIEKKWNQITDNITLKVDREINHKRDTKSRWNQASYRDEKDIQIAKYLNNFFDLYIKNIISKNASYKNIHDLLPNTFKEWITKSTYVNLTTTPDPIKNPLISLPLLKKFGGMIEPADDTFDELQKKTHDRKMAYSLLEDIVKQSKLFKEMTPV